MILMSQLFKTVKMESLFFHRKAKLTLPGLTIINNTSQEAANEFQDQTKGLDSMDQYPNTQNQKEGICAEGLKEVVLFQSWLAQTMSRRSPKIEARILGCFAECCGTFRNIRCYSLVRYVGVI